MNSKCNAICFYRTRGDLASYTVAKEYRLSTLLEILRQVVDVAKTELADERRRGWRVRSQTVIIHHDDEW